jgi:hypothetical protein
MLFTPTKRGEEEMKKMLLVSAASALFVAGSALAQSETVTSVNVVGYHSVTIPNNGLALVTPVLESFDPGTIGDLVGSQVPGGTEAFIWDRVSNTYITDSLGRGGWGSTNIILRGDAVWLKPPAESGDVTVTFMGEVPASYNAAGTTTVTSISGLDAVGYSYPVDVLWTNTALAAALPGGAEVFVWNLTNQTYDTYSKGRGGWGVGDSLVIKAGMAFWVNGADPTDWTEEAPYTLDQ